ARTAATTRDSGTVLLILGRSVPGDARKRKVKQGLRTHRVDRLATPDLCSHPAHGGSRMVAHEDAVGHLAGGPGGRAQRVRPHRALWSRSAVQVAFKFGRSLLLTRDYS